MSTKIVFEALYRALRELNEIMTGKTDNTRDILDVRISDRRIL